jgi:hypothetical protein
MTAVYLTTYLPVGPTRPRRIRRRRKIAEGEKIRLGLARLQDLAPEMSDENGDEVQSLFVDGEPVAFVNPFSEEWLVDGGLTGGTGLDFVTKP